MCPEDIYFIQCSHLIDMYASQAHNLLVGTVRPDGQTMRLVPWSALIVVVVHDPAVEGFVSGMAAWCVRMKDFVLGTQTS